MRRALQAVIYLAIVVMLSGLGWASAHAAPVAAEVKGRLVSGHWTKTHRHRSHHIAVDWGKLHHAHPSRHMAMDWHKLHHSRLSHRAETTPPTTR